MEGGCVWELWADPREVAQGSKLSHREILLGGSGEDLGGRCLQSQWVTWELSSHQSSPARTLIRLCLEATPKVPLVCSWRGHDFISNQHSPPDPDTYYLILLVPHMTVWTPSLTWLQDTCKPQKRGQVSGEPADTAPGVTWAGGAGRKEWVIKLPLLCLQMLYMLVQ